MSTNDAGTGGVPAQESPDQDLVMLPASFAQELFWLMQHSAPDNTSYNVPRVRYLEGALNADALERALGELVERHEILRTTYATHEEQTVQVIHPPRPVYMERIDLSGIAAADQSAAVERALRERMALPFDLSTDLLVRATLIRTRDSKHVLLLESHHIAFDGWSRDILFRELDAFYRAAINGQPASLPALSIQYADFAIWQREHLAGERLQALLSYWRAALSDASFTLDLPSDRPRPARPGFDSAVASLHIEPAAVDSLTALARAHGATFYMVLLTAYMTVLQRWTGQADILVGSPVAGRARAETEGLIGYFANTVVQRGRFTGDPTFTDVLAGVRDSTLGAFDHQDVPFERLVLELAGVQDASRSPIFQVVFTQLGVQNDAAPRLGDVEMNTFAVDIGVTKFDLTLLFSQRPTGVDLTLRYRTDLFSDVFAARFMRQLRAVLDAVVADPSRHISQIPVLSPEEVAQLATWNDTTVDEGQPATVVDLFEAHAARVPDRIAVAEPSGLALTYAELDARANQLAHMLVSAGVTSNQPVGLLLDRSVDAVIALLAIMKAGGAYMPLSVDSPAPRIADQVRESGARVVVTNAERSDRVPASARTIVVDSGADAIRSQPRTRPERSTTADHLAYVLFTSGSTGVPKGVAVSHANIVHYTRAVSRVLADVPQSRPGDGFAALDGLHFGLMSTIAADLGNTSLFGSLLAGGTLHVLDKTTATEPSRFAGYVGAHRLDIVKAAPNHIAALVAGRTGAELSAALPARWLVVGGEALRFDVARMVLSAHSCRVLNHYGPTEVTVGVLTNEVTTPMLPAVQAAGAYTVPMGRPLPNTHAYVLNAQRAELSTGLVGELYIGGAGVTNGYLGRTDLTNERFFEFRGERIYRTGDRVRRMPDGTIEFLGRADDQVKVRGYRVELGEIEQALRDHPGVENGIVVLATTDGGDARLVAYVVPKASGYAVSHGDRATVESVTAWLAGRLIDYMVPVAIVFIESIPLTANGKVDKAALPSASDITSAEAGRVAPRTDSEEKLVQIWSDVLKKPDVGVTDNFLELGGHSLFAIRVLGKISKAFGVRLPLRTLFDAPTIAELAEIVDMEVKLAALEKMSDEEAAQLLASMPNSDVAK